MTKHLSLIGLAVVLLLSSCSEERFGTPENGSGDRNLITLAGEITQECTTRANDGGFADGDVMGVYIVDYKGEQPGTLLSAGNRGDNVRHTFDEARYRWNSAYDLYWKDGHTRIDVYGYYPFASPDDVNNYKFTIRTNQARTYDDGTMGDYEASDFLWGKVAGVEPTTSIIRLPLSHRMANARVTLVEGSGFADGEWTGLEKQILVTNTVQTAIIDLATGSVSPEGEVAAKAIIPSKRGDEWRAIVVPQTVAAGTTMFSVTLGGIPYKFVKNEAFEYVAGKMNNFGIRVDKKENTGDYTLSLISESITPWENDLVSHDATSREYVIVNVPKAGTLKETILAEGKDYTKIKNLKLTGETDANDFYFMRDEMPLLRAINLKDIKIKAFGNQEDELFACREDQIPRYAFADKSTLISLILPDKLKSIGNCAFQNCTSITGSLIIPEGVTDIVACAFFECRSLDGVLSLPSTLLSIGDDAFYCCGFTSELSIPENVEYIGLGAFDGCRYLYGSLRLPDKLKTIGRYAFDGCTGLTGSLEIPKGVVNIPDYAFRSCGFNGNLILHNNINILGSGAFENCHFKGEIVLPQKLMIIEDGVFERCDFSGELIFPKSLVSIGRSAFAYNRRLIGSLEFPEGLETIGENAFADCSYLEKLVFPKSLEVIRKCAFQNCYGVGSIVCKSDIPANIHPSTFDGIAKDNLSLEVPESAITQYHTAQGWCDFKRITAHHELVCKPSVACALSTEHKQLLYIDAEGDWEVESIPAWCELSQNSGSKKSEITLTVKASSATENREGDIVFRLKDKDYTHSCHVTQYGYPYGEDEYLTLQKATKGNNGGINIVILGDGYDTREISDGSYLSDIQQTMEYFFGIEPYTTYRDYFNVYTAFPLSTESGVGTVNTIRYNRFGTTYTGGSNLKCDYDMVFDYAMNAPTVNAGNINQTLIIMVPNSTDYGGSTQMWGGGAAIAFCPKSTYAYPFDSRGVVQHEAGGHGFGKLGDENIYHNAFIDACCCGCCGHVDELLMMKALGWYDNLELTGKMHQVGWSHLIFDPRYSNLVDIYEGGYMHSRGVFRSEQNSCMNNNIPYYSTISRESIVRRIKQYAGEQFDFEEFVALDKSTMQAASRSGGDAGPVNIGMRSTPPVFHKGSPLRK